MFITNTRSGYRGTEQFTSGLFLLVFSHNQFKWAEQNGKPWQECPYSGRELYACVRKVALRQMGHWMMGIARIAGQSVTVSGAYGSDGLPMDYEKVSPAGRLLLTRVPDDLTEQFWQGGGHNSAGNEARAMRDWARRELVGKAYRTKNGRELHGQNVVLDPSTESKEVSK